MRVRPLTSIEDCRRVAALEREIWSYTDFEDVIPPPVLVVSIKRGGILLGGFDAAGALKGFVYSTAGVKDGRFTQWSHLLGVVSDARATGLGAELKLAQREAAMKMGVELIEWTFDPLQAINAHFNFAKLGVVVEEYGENVYGASSSPLHAGAPTDRFIAAWHITRPHVERRIGSSTRSAVRDQSVSAAPIVNPSIARALWSSPGPANLVVDERRVLVEIPAGFTEMLADDPPLALEWRLHTREVFQAYLRSGYQVVDFFLSRGAGRGHYLLARTI